MTTLPSTWSEAYCRVAQHGSVRELMGGNRIFGMGLGGAPTKPYQKSSWITGKKASRNPSDVLSRNRPGFSLQNGAEPESVGRLAWKKGVHKLQFWWKRSSTNLTRSQWVITCESQKCYRGNHKNQPCLLCLFLPTTGVRVFSRGFGDMAGNHHLKRTIASARGNGVKSSPKIWDKVGESCYKLKQLMDVSSTNG